jgi:hypothetical protein
MKLINLFEFETQNDGVLKMETFDYPCAFIVGSEIFDYQGNPLVLNEQYIIVPNKTLSLVIGFGNEETTEGYTYVQDNICYVNMIPQ